MKFLHLISHEDHCYYYHYFYQIILNALEYVPITFETNQLFPYYIFGMNLSMLAS